MLTTIRNKISKYDRKPIRIAAITLILLSLLVCAYVAIFDIYADDGGFTLKIQWMDPGADSTANSFVYNSNKDENRLVRLRVSYRNESPTQGYAPGELIITINGIGGARRSGNAMPAAIAADAASSTNKMFNWSYTYSLATDTYTFTNNSRIDANTTFDGMFELVWNLNSRDTINNYSNTISAKLRTAHYEEVSSNTIRYSQTRVKDVYTVSHNAKALYSPEGLTSLLPTGTTADDYTFVNYTVNGSDTYKSLDVRGSETFHIFVPQGAIVQSPSYTFTKTGETRVIDNVTCEVYSVFRSISRNTINPYLSDIYIAYPDSLYKDKKVTTRVEIRGTYYEDAAESIVAVHNLILNLADYGYIQIPGDIYTTYKTSHGVGSTYIYNHCDYCWDYGAFNQDHFEGGHEYSSTLNVLLNYSADASQYYDLEFTDDFLDVTLRDGTLRSLRDDEYHFTKIVLSGSNSMTNANGYNISADTYPVEIYIRRSGQTAFETTPYMNTMIRASSQTINLPDDTCAVRILVKGVKESIWETAGIATLYYVFHTTDTDIRTDNGTIYNNMYFNLYDQNGWANNQFDHNPSAYNNNREYQRDLDTYGHTFDREYAYLHVLEVPNEFSGDNSIDLTGEDANFFHFTQNIDSSFSYMAEGTISQFSQYTILPTDMYLANSIINQNTLLNTVTFSSNQSGINDDYIRDRCIVEIIHDYKGTGRVYIAFHYDFSDDPISATNISVSGIPVYSSKDSIETVNKTYTMYAMTLVDQTNGKWYSQYNDIEGTENNDNQSIEDSVWQDIDRDGNTAEYAYLSDSQVTVYKPPFAQLSVIKSVATTNTNAFEVPTQQEDGTFIWEEIPQQYFGYNYNYRLTLTTGQGCATNVVLCDVIEREGDWQGEFQSVSYVRAAMQMGVIPTIWYSSNVEDISTKPNFTTGGWTKVKPVTVRSVAVDFGTAVLGVGKVLYVELIMKAPQEDLSLMDKYAANKYTAYYTSVDAETGFPIEDTYLPSNTVPVRLSPYRGVIRLNKVDAIDFTSISGAQFKMYMMTGTSPDTEVDTFIGEYTTDSNGLITVRNLAYGEYYFIEEAAPKGYIISSDIFKISLQSDEPNAATSITVSNTRKPGQVELVKVNNLDNTIKVAGARFSLYTADGILVKDGFADNLVTDSDGILKVTGLEWGSYYFIEIEVPSGYELYTAQIPFTISAANDAGLELSVTVKDPQIPAGVILTKYEVLEDGVTQTAVSVDGAAYELYKVMSGGDMLIGTYMTDDEGKIYADGLSFGSYYFKETIAAQGYLLNTTNIPFILTAENITVSTYARIDTTDTRRTGNVWLQKTDVSGYYVKGAVYGFYNADSNKLIAEYTTNDEGIIEIDNIYWGNYYIRETKAPIGYELDTTKHEFSITRQNVHNIVLYNAHDDRALGSIKLVKVSEQNENIRLQGAVFNLYRANGSLVLSELTTDVNGELTVTDLEWGSYYFEETKAPTGYGLNTSKIRFSVNYLTGGNTQEIIVTDPAISKDIEIVKRIRTSELVFTHGNATFTFELKGTDINGEERTMYRTVTFDEAYYNIHKSDTYLELSVRFTGLLSGNYTVREIDINRYTLSNPVLEVSANGVLSVDRLSVAFNLTGSNTGKATFFNIKDDQTLSSHTSQITNILQKNAKLTAITAKWNGGVVASEVLDRTQLDVYAIYDDGTSVKLADDAYTLNPEAFDQSMNGEYTVLVSYTENGITRTDTFDLTLNVPVPFTWEVLSNQSNTYNGEAYDGTVTITGYTGGSMVVSFPTEVTGIRKWSDTGNHTYTDNGKKYRVIGIGLRDIALISNARVKGILDTQVTALQIPEGILEINKSAFYGCSNLIGDLVIPNTVTSIDEAAFRGTGYTGTLTLGRDLERIGAAAFYAVPFSGALVIPDKVKDIGMMAFQNTKFTGGLTLGKEVVEIGTSAFNGVPFSGSLVIPNSVKYINENAFYETGFTGTLTLGEELITIGEYAFVRVKFTGSLVIPNKVTSIGRNAFRSAGFTGTVTLSEELVTIGDSAFYSVLFTGSLVIPNKVTSIGRMAFAYSRFAGTLTLGEELTTIGESAFMGASFTGSLVMPNKVTSIGSTAFYNARFTGTTVIPTSLETVGSSIFANCHNLSLMVPSKLSNIVWGVPTSSITYY